MRILVIEDNIKLAASIKRGLEQDGFAVDCLFDGKSGQERLEISHSDYDLLILDIMLPEVDGLTICKNIRNQNIAIPIIMLTARGTTADKILGLNSGADDYLIKPFSFEELVARIKALLRRPKQALQVELKIGDLILNATSKKVYRNQKEIELTLKEFSLLEYLMRNANQVLNRDQILDHVWDLAFDSFSNIVDVHIKNLRKKIDNGYHEKLLETIRGVGYRLKN